MISRELGVFFIVGACTVLLDIGCYSELLYAGLTPLDFANRFWTFGDVKHETTGVSAIIIFLNMKSFVFAIASANRASDS